MKEGISINKGLLCLGQVISALTEEKNKKESKTAKGYRFYILAIQAKRFSREGFED